MARLRTLEKARGFELFLREADLNLSQALPAPGPGSTKTHRLWGGPLQLNLISLVLRTLAKERGSLFCKGSRRDTNLVAARRRHRGPQKRIVLGVGRRHRGPQKRIVLGVGRRHRGPQKRIVLGVGRRHRGPQKRIVLGVGRRHRGPQKRIVLGVGRRQNRSLHHERYTIALTFAATSSERRNFFLFLQAPAVVRTNENRRAALAECQTGFATSKNLLEKCKVRRDEARVDWEACLNKLDTCQNYTNETFDNYNKLCTKLEHFNNYKNKTINLHSEPHSNPQQN